MTPPRALIQCPDCKRLTRNWYQGMTRKLCHLCYERDKCRELREEFRKEQGTKGGRRSGC